MNETMKVSVIKIILNGENDQSMQIFSYKATYGALNNALEVPNTRTNFDSSNEQIVIVESDETSSSVAKGKTMHVSEDKISV